MDTPNPPALPPFAAVIVAAGQGLRAGQPLPKQFAPFRGKTVLRHAAEALAEAGASPIAVAIPEGADVLAAGLLAGLDNVLLLQGGDTRQDSVALALDVLASNPPEFVLIHDAARPDCPPAVIERLLAALADAPGAIPVLPVVDSVIRLSGEADDRNQIRRVQTPQAFRFTSIHDAHGTWQGAPLAGDDAEVLRAAGGEVALVAGDERLRKLTFAEDFTVPTALPFRTGTGFDVHRLTAGEDLWLCGVKIDHPLGLAGHSDADVAIHALVDAILGAVGAGDIGDHFPPSDPRWRGAPSARFLQHAAALAAEQGYAIGNVDVTLICEAPKIGPHKLAMRERLAAILGVDVARVSVKATTTERLGLTGRGEGIAAQAVASLIAENQ